MAHRRIVSRSEIAMTAYARKGMATGAFSGMVWGLDGAILGVAMAMSPFTGGVSIITAPLAGAALHDGFAALWLLLINLFTGKSGEIAKTLRSRPGRLVCLAALLGGPVGMAGYLMSIANAGAAYAMAVSAIYPALGALMARVFLKERISARVWAGIAVCVAGAIVTGYAPPEQAAAGGFYTGIAFALLAATGWAAEGVLSTYGMDLLDPDIAINIRQAVSFAVYLVIVVPLAGALPVLGRAVVSKSMGVVALAGLAGAVSFLAWYRSLNMCGVGRAMALNITYALWGIVFGLLFFGLELSAGLVAGALMITAGALTIVTENRSTGTLRAVESKPATGIADVAVKDAGALPVKMLILYVSATVGPVSAGVLLEEINKYMPGVRGYDPGRLEDNLLPLQMAGLIERAENGVNAEGENGDLFKVTGRGLDMIKRNMM
ncbi:MAG TPA: EamA family transporter [bacterium]|nr:EamA family transporter [bacterium]